MPGHFEAMKMVCANKGSYVAKVGSSHEVTQLVAHFKGRTLDILNCFLEFKWLNGIQVFYSNAYQDWTGSECNVFRNLVNIALIWLVG